MKPVSASCNSEDTGDAWKSNSLALPRVTLSTLLLGFDAAAETGYLRFKADRIVPFQPLRFLYYALSAISLVRLCLCPQLIPGIYAVVFFGPCYCLPYFRAAPILVERICCIGMLCCCWVTYLYATGVPMPDTHAKLVESDSILIFSLMTAALHQLRLPGLLLVRAFVFITHTMLLRSMHEPNAILRAFALSFLVGALGVSLEFFHRRAFVKRCITSTNSSNPASTPLHRQREAHPVLSALAAGTPAPALSAATSASATGEVQEHASMCHATPQASKLLDWPACDAIQPEPPCSSPSEEDLHHPDGYMYTACGAISAAAPCLRYLYEPEPLLQRSAASMLHRAAFMHDLSFDSVGDEMLPPALCCLYNPSRSVAWAALPVAPGGLWWLNITGREGSRTPHSACPALPAARSDALAETAADHLMAFVRGDDLHSLRSFQFPLETGEEHFIEPAAATVSRLDGQSVSRGVGSWN